MKPIKLKKDLTPERVNEAMQGLRMLMNENAILRQLVLDAYFLLTGGTIFEEIVKKDSDFPTTESWVRRYMKIFPDEEEHA